MTLVFTSCNENQLNNELVIAHRGVPYFAPEETLAAFVLARDLGADYLEADLQRTKDGIIICLHDDNLTRTTNISEVYPDRAKDPVSSFTWEELQKLDAGSWFNNKYPEMARPAYINLKIISLEQLIDIAESGPKEPGIYLETKHPELFPGIEADLKKVLNNKGWHNKTLSNGLPAVILQSFVPSSIEILRKEFPGTPIAYLLWTGEGCLQKFDKAHLTSCLDFADSLDVKLIGASFSGEQTRYFNQLEPWFLEAVAEREMRIHAYTFNTINDIKTYAPLTAGQFTNRTDLQLDYYGREHPEVEQVLTENGY